MMAAMAASVTQTFADKVQDLAERVQYKRVHTRQQLDEILSLRYEAYIKEGALEPNSSGKLEDQFDHGANVRNIGVYLDGDLISALRIHVLQGTQRVSPATETFPELLVPELDKGKVILDPNRFVADYRRARSLPELPYVTLRLAFMAADFYNADMTTATVRAEHQAFYSRILHYSPLCEPRTYPKLTKPIGLMGADFKKERAAVLRRYPFFASTIAEREALFRDFAPRPRSTHLREGARSDVNGGYFHARSMLDTMPPKCWSE
jgi:N-acyl-L-homoserine lactone synthetase